MAGRLVFGARDGEQRPFWMDENVRGIAIVIAGGAALVALAFGVMVVLTSPDGWVTKAATQAMTSEQGVSYESAEAR